MPVSSCHSYPFDKLPTLVLHVKPHFVICDAGPKLVHQELEVLTPITCVISGLPKIAAASMLDIMQDTYYTWCQVRPSLIFTSAPCTCHNVLCSVACSKLPDQCHRFPTFCLGPCFYSKHNWSPHWCTHCKEILDPCRLHNEHLASLDSDDNLLTCDSLDKVEDGT